MIAQACPHCGQTNRVVRYGTTKAGSTRCLCRECHKTFTPHPMSRAMTPQKEAQILRALQERLSQRGIARTFKVGRQTIRAIRKKGHSA